MRNTYLYKGLNTLDANDVSGFLDLVQVWAPFPGADWRLFLIFFLENAASKDAGTRGAFLNGWNDFCRSNEEDFLNQYKFLPPPRVSNDRCDDQWLNQIMSQLVAWLLEYRVVLRLRASTMHKTLKGKKPSFLTEFQSYLDGKVGKDHPTALFVVSFSLDAFSNPPRRDCTFFKQWAGRDDLQGERLERIILDAECHLKDFISRQKVKKLELVRMLEKMKSLEHDEFLWYLKRPNPSSKACGAFSLVEILMKEVVNGNGIGEDDIIRHWKSKKVPNSKDVTQLHECIEFARSKLVEYVAMVHSQTNGVGTAVLAIQAVRQREWYEFFDSELARTMRTLEKLSKDDHYWLYRLQIEESYLEYALSSPIRYDSNAFQNAMTYVENYFLILRLQLACAAENQDQIVGIERREDLLRTAIPLILKNPDGLPMLAKVYQMAYDLLANIGDRKRFVVLLNEVEKESANIPQEIRRDLYIYLINFCLRQVNAGNLDYLLEIEQIYRKTMAGGDLLKAGKIEGDDLKNMVTLLTRFGQTALAGELLDSYADKIATGSNSYIYEYLKQLLMYFNGEYQKKNNGFRDLVKGFQVIMDHSTDVFNVIDAWAFQWRTAFDNGDFEFIRSDKSRFKMHLNRLTILPSAHRNRYHNFRRHLVSLAFMMERIEATLKKKIPTGADRVLLSKTKTKALAQLETLQREKNTIGYRWLKVQMQNIINLHWT